MRTHTSILIFQPSPRSFTLYCSFGSNRCRPTSCNFQETVPQLNLRDIKKKHREREISQDSTSKSSDVYVTARDGIEEDGGSSRSDTSDIVSGEVAREAVGKGMKQARAPSEYSVLFSFFHALEV